MQQDIEMTTLDELLAEDGFKRGSRAGSSTTSLSTSLLGSVSEVRPAKTRLGVNLRRSVSAASEKAGSKQPMQSNGAGRGRLLDSNGRTFSFFNALEKVDESPGNSHRSSSSIEASNVNSKASMVLESNLRYSRFLRNNLYENKEPKGTKTPISQAKPSCVKYARFGRPMPALDNAELKAMASMLNSCVNQILNDENLRSSLHQACVSSVKSTWVQYRQSKENGVISVLVEAIEAVERIIAQGLNQFELKKAFAMLSVISGLKSTESDDEHASGIPSSHLAACGHLYLSILYKIQKKDNISAIHLLQVFCDSPYHARKTLLPELWNHLFSSNVSHLKAWYEKEEISVPVTSGVMKKPEFLEKVYNDVVDMVTSQFAAYYKGWLTVDNNGSALPSIRIPFAPVSDVEDDADEVASFKSFNSSKSVPSRTMISKRLYFDLSQAKADRTTDEMESREEDEVDEVWDEAEEREADAWIRKCDELAQKDNETDSCFTELGGYETESFQEDYDACSKQSASSFEITPEIDRIIENHCRSSSSDFLEAEEIKHRSKMVRYSDDNIRHMIVRKCDSEENKNGFKLKKPAKAAFQLQVADHSNEANTHTSKLLIDSPVYNSEQDEMTELTRTKLVLDETDTANEFFSSGSLSDIFEENYQDSFFSRIPEEFICPLTRRLFKEPVTLESGHTFELVAIKARFNQGNRTCPITGQTLKCLLIPDTNTVLKHLISEWLANCFRNSTYVASQNTFSTSKPARNDSCGLSLVIVDQILSGFSLKEEKENVKRLISLGGLQFLIKMLEVGSLEEKSRVAEILVKCIQADGGCRNHLAMKISKSSVLNLIHSKEVRARARAVSLLIELICLHRRVDNLSFLSALKTEDIDNTKRELLLCLRSSLPEERVLIAVLLLYLDFMDESRKYSVYKEEAVKCIVKALECCLFSKKFIPNCQRALLMLGGHFSFTGEMIIESWLLKKAGYICKTCNDEDDRTISEEESKMKEEWLKSMASILLHYGKKSFEKTLSKCWKNGDRDLARVCTITAAWLSHALLSLSVPALQLSVFWAFMPRLKECLKIDLDIELKVFASLSLLNFSKILECRIPLITFADEIHEPLKRLKQVTWTANHLYNDIFGENS